MKFLIDEDIPVKLLAFLQSKGFDCTRAAPATPDPELARLAKKEGRVLITLDKDFTNIVMYPPANFNIVKIQIHPPLIESILTAFEKLLANLPPNDFKGLILLQEKGHLKISE